MKHLRKFFAAVVLLLVGCIAPPRTEAQFIGYTSAQSTTSTPFNGVTCTAALLSPRVNVTNIGQGAHWLTFTAGNPSTLTYTLQGSYDGVNFFDISDVGTFTVNSAGFAGLQATGYYPVVAVNVGACTPGAATIKLQYSGMSLTPGVPTGTAQIGQLIKNIAVLNAANTSFQSSVLRSPFGSANGTLQFVYTGAAGPSGSTLQVQCGTNAAFVPNATQAFALQTTQSLVQAFQIPAINCPFFTVFYTSGGASAANYNLDFAFANPGIPIAGQQYTHITGTTATVIKPVAGYLHTLSINLGGAGTVSIFDLPAASCTGTPASNQIAIITATATTLQTFTYDVNLVNGICVKASAAMDLTVSAQ